MDLLGQLLQVRDFTLEAASSLYIGSYFIPILFHLIQLNYSTHSTTFVQKSNIQAMDILSILFRVPLAIVYMVT